MQNKNTNEKATAPQEATVAKTAKEAAIDPKTGDEIIAMTIKFYDAKTHKEVINDELEQRIRLSLNRFLHIVDKGGIVVNLKEDAEKFDELTEDPKCYNARYWLSHISSLGETCDYLDLMASITLDKNIGGIRQIIVYNSWKYGIVTESCYSHLDDNTNLLTDANEYYGPDGKIIKTGNKLLCSMMIGDCFSIFYDAIDIDREAKRLVEWVKNM